MNRHEAIEQALKDLIDSVEAHQYGTGTLKAIREYCRQARETLALPKDTAEPVAYITRAALDALKRGASSSVRVWLNPDEPNEDVALYTKDSL
jgi:hypothetical protein